ncbi:Putative predicted metal-dependent hydrolase [Bathymodiolus heckerae thiotrophic gill symbiont]|uniref:M48 family metallopeptidase n=1 Tax=Bathymodiolus heckerae thiotrophic gill symbiont TaxID=1052212 RepID=UPI0010BA92B8|nr:SprT family zinc-dependent metalloprotease [Bathymodiolus heckerae thiotrophic gill symbiont]SMN13051.1 Putative predicted metal-dependent hydrolase [Bathymodiolus heckerae thiotrophic gill symbiont]SMN15347.1 Putative predicted metal-dependent hydrolase [uncultured Candidatus Thioglobus sp.]
MKLPYYQLIRSKRKTLSLQINRSGELLVRAPQQLSVKKIEAFIREKSAWIEKKTQTLRENAQPKPTYLNGEVFLYLGNYYPLIREQAPKNKLEFEGKVFKLSSADNGSTEFHRWYKASFKKIALPRLDYYADLHQLNYQKVRLKSQKTLWGSCSSANNINLNYLLIGAPISVIDYVIVHELAHIKHKNHSKVFWQLVAFILPEYKTEKQWLKDHGHKLHNL